MCITRTSHPSAFGGVEAVHRAAKEDNKRISRREIRNWLKGRETYTLHKPLRRRFPRNRVIVSGIDSQWQADLVDVSAFSRINRGHKYILTCIDVFSKFAWARPLKKKKGDGIVRAFQSIFREKNRRPKKLQTDKGGEFLNKTVQTFLKSNRIQYFTTNNETKASIVERFNRTLKSKMWRFFTAKGTRRYVDVLQDFMKGYNGSYHRSIGMAPETVTKLNQETVWHNLYGTGTEMLSEMPTFRFGVGDPVRISMATRPFRKSYLPQWTDEVFTIAKRIARTPPVYELKDYNQDNIEGHFYEQELQRISKADHTYRIEKWEVGLTEILYPHQWYNIDEDCKYTYTVNGHQWWTKPLTPGFYRDPSTLLELLETNYVEEIRYRLDRQNGLISIQLAEGAQVKFEGRLAEILGFPSTSTVTSSSTINHPFDLKHIHHMFVYSDIIEPHAVGHTKVPLIRVVTVKGKYGEDISSVYDNVYYHPVKQKYFDTIEIDIRDNTGRKITISSRHRHRDTSLSSSQSSTVYLKIFKNKHHASFTISE
ncbi:hypothetical protein BSL78_20570 [Apostichopus japonicus]|uniref:Integrase catalytic domain-containing protein n=1 Tax=Stichopus japonicus TaxID=307972 RepID=A0A2G8K3L0_STIJA|nr:hypothetical protein BSL78_20570 [Apostichopus japonicus]